MSCWFSTVAFNLWRGDPWSAAQLHVIFQRRTVQLLLLPTRSSSLNHTFCTHHCSIYTFFQNFIPLFQLFTWIFCFGCCCCLCSVCSHASAHWLHCLRVLSTSRNIRIFWHHPVATARLHMPGGSLRHEGEILESHGSAGDPISRKTND